MNITSLHRGMHASVPASSFPVFVKEKSCRHHACSLCNKLSYSVLLLFHGIADFSDELIRVLSLMRTHMIDIEHWSGAFIAVIVDP